MLTTTTTRNRHTSDGSVFAFTFRVDDSSELDVYRQNTSGVVSLLTEGPGASQYSVSGVGDDAGGTVTLGTALNGSGGEVLVIQRDAPYTQPTDYRNQSRVSTETVELSLDSVVKQIQQLNTLLGRSLTLGVIDVDGSGVYDLNGNRLTGVGAPVDDDDLVTKSYHDPQVYTTGTKPAASGVDAGTWIIVRDPGLPDVLQMALTKADGSTKEWATIAMAPVI